MRTCILFLSEKILSRTFLLPGSTCKCNDLTSLGGLFGQCKVFEETGKRYCYVQQPTSCLDAKPSKSRFLPGEKYSEEACNGRFFDYKFYLD